MSAAQWISECLHLDDRKDRLDADTGKVLRPAAGEMYLALSTNYRAWCAERGIEPARLHELSAALVAAGLRPDTQAGKRVYLGCTIKREALRDRRGRLLWS